MVKDETKWRLRLSQTIKPAVRGALRTLLTLFGGLLIGLLTGDLTFRMIPGSSIENVKIGHAAVAALPALLGFLAGGAAWGLQMGRLAGSHETRRLTLAGMLGFGPVAILLATILGVAEPAIVGYLGARGQPIHRVFTLLFVPSTFLIAGTGAWAVGRGLHELHLARHLFWQVGLAAAATQQKFELIDIRDGPGITRNTDDHVTGLQQRAILVVSVGDHQARTVVVVFDEHDRHRRR